MILLELFLTFFKIGAFTIGGGYAMIPLIQQEMVGRGWMAAQEVTDIVAISQMTPGPFSVNAATFAGTQIAGIPGAIFSTLGLIAPSVIIMLIIAKFFFNFQKNRHVQGVLSGIRPAVVALLGSAFISMASASLFFAGAESFLASIDWICVAIAAVSFVSLVWLKVHPILMILGSGAVGILLFTILGL